MKKLTVIMLFLVVLTGFSACETTHFKYQKVYIGAFDTVTVLTGYSDKQKNFDTVAKAIYDELEEYGKLFDIYNEYDGINNLKTVNDNAGKNAVVVDERIMDLLEFAIKMYDETDGNVNIALGSVLEIWHDAREEALDSPENAKLPDIKLLRKAKEHCDIGNIVIDREKSTVFIRDEKTRIDVGAVAKGFAVEEVCKKYDGLGYSMVVSVGGNVRTIGTDEANGNWSVGIENPDNTEKLIETVNVLGGASVVTSGNYERYFEVDGVRYNHIIDAESLMPATKFKSVSIVCNDSAMADALSTALFIMDYEDGRMLIEKINGAEAMWIDIDGNVMKTDGFAEMCGKK